MRAITDFECNMLKKPKIIWKKRRSVTRNVLFEMMEKSYNSINQSKSCNINQSKPIDKFYLLKRSSYFFRSCNRSSYVIRWILPKSHPYLSLISYKFNWLLISSAVVICFSSQPTTYITVLRIFFIIFNILKSLNSKNKEYLLNCVRK